MPLVTTTSMLKQAQTNGYAIGAFNVENLEMIQAVISAAEQSQSPVLLQTTPSTVRYSSLPAFHAMVSTLASQVSVPVALHLDHGNTVDLAMQALREGYTSIMIDGSHETLEQNIVMTKQVVVAAHANSIPVEGELGKVGGKEDDLEAEADTNTDPDDAVAYVEQTGIDSLAIAIGTAHGFYNGTPVLDLERLSEIRKRVSIPLVLHGASGLSDDDIRACIARGICKVNFATDLRVAYSKGVKELLAEKPDTFDPKAYGKAGYEKVKALVLDRMAVCGCLGKACL